MTDKSSKLRYRVRLILNKLLTKLSQEYDTYNLTPAKRSECQLYQIDYCFCTRLFRVIDSNTMHITSL